jgi:hypothetical protein
LPDELFIHLSFSLWHGWTTVLLFVSAFAAFGVDTDHERHWLPPDTTTKVLVILALCFLEGTAAAYTFAEGGLAGSFAIAWSLWAIFAYQEDPFIHWTVFAFALIALVWVVKAAVRRVRRGGIYLEDDDEGAPVLGGGSGV